MQAIIHQLASITISAPAWVRIFWTICKCGWDYTRCTCGKDQRRRRRYPRNSLFWSQALPIEIKCWNLSRARACVCDPGWVTGALLKVRCEARLSAQLLTQELFNYCANCMRLNSRWLQVWSYSGEMSFSGFGVGFTLGACQRSSIRDERLTPDSPGHFTHAFGRESGDFLNSKSH